MDPKCPTCPMAATVACVAYERLCLNHAARPEKHRGLILAINAGAIPTSPRPGKGRPAGSHGGCCPPEP